MRQIKALIIGEYGFFMNHLIERLNREKCDIYTISGKKSKEKSKGLPKHVTFEFSAAGLDVKYIIQCVQPEIVIFMGAQNDAYDWENEQASLQYNAELTNVLMWSKEYDVEKFIYLSTMDVYENEFQIPITEELEPKAKSIKNVMILNGESLCKLYGDSSMQITVLRFPQVYGPLHFHYEKLNKVGQMCYAVKNHFPYECNEKLNYMTIYVSDAVEAIFRIMKGKRCQEMLYHVEGQSLTNDAELLYKINTIGGFKENISTQGEKKAETRTVNPDGRRFAEEFYYRPIITLEKGLKNTIQDVNRKNKILLEKDRAHREVKAQSAMSQVKKNVLSVLKTSVKIFENLLLFAIFFALQYFMGNNSAFSGFDFMLLYIVVASLAFGVGSGIFAVIVATCVEFASLIYEGISLSSLLYSYSTITELLFRFIISIMISYTILRLKNTVRENKEQIKEIEEEYELIYEINQTNVEIKKAFEDRLVNYGDSIGKIYNIVSQLDLLDPERIVDASLGVICKIMHVTDVCIYKGSESGYFHFMNASTLDARVLKKTIRLEEFPEMQRAMEARDIFINKDADQQLPRMVAPIYSGNQLIYIIMLWNVEFEQLNSYQKNLFLVLSKIITSSLEKGYQYEEIGRDKRYYKDTDVMLPEAFLEFVNEKTEQQKTGGLEYTLLKIISEPGTDLAALGNELSELIRDHDKVGKLSEEDDILYVLVQASQEEVQFVIKRFANNGICSEVIG